MSDQCRSCGAPVASTPQYACDRYCPIHCYRKRHEHDCERGWRRASVYARHRISRRRTAELYRDATVIHSDPSVTSTYGEPQV